MLTRDCQTDCHQENTAGEAVGKKRRRPLYVHESRIRDLYAQTLTAERPFERFVKKEVRYPQSPVRADMRTVDYNDLLREWEFKIHADYRALGQILIYVARARKELAFRPVRGVIAAFTFLPELRHAVEIMNLNIELLTLPPWMRAAGGVPPDSDPVRLVRIPSVSY